MQDRRTPPLADMAKPEAKLAEMVKEESKPVAEANGAMPHVKSESQQAAAQVLIHAQVLISPSLRLLYHIMSQLRAGQVECSAPDVKPKARLQQDGSALATVKRVCASKACFRHQEGRGREFAQPAVH